MTRIIIALAIVCCAGAALAASRARTFYDPAGRVTGKARSEDGITTFYDPAGRAPERPAPRTARPLITTGVGA